MKLALELGGDVNVGRQERQHRDARRGLQAACRRSSSCSASKGADVNVWNRKNVSGWTPLRIAVGVHRGMNFRFHVPTADALREIMVNAGVSTEVEPETVISGATPTK